MVETHERCTARRRYQHGVGRNRPVRHLVPKDVHCLEDGTSSTIGNGTLEQHAQALPRWSLHEQHRITANLSGGNHHRYPACEGSLCHHGGEGFVFDLLETRGRQTRTRVAKEDGPAELREELRLGRVTTNDHRFDRNRANGPPVTDGSPPSRGLQSEVPNRRANGGEESSNVISARESLRRANEEVHDGHCGPRQNDRGGHRRRHP